MRLGFYCGGCSAVNRSECRIRVRCQASGNAATRQRGHELRINDASGNWRMMYRIDSDAIVIAEIFLKKTPKTPKTVVETCRRRLKEYDDARK